MKQIGKVGKINVRANLKLKKLFEENDIRSCEINLPGCMKTFALSWHHRHKRIWYRSQPEKLSEWKQAILSCAKCHHFAEQDAEFTEEIFLRLRGEES
jgi:hypothetical protein